MAGLIGAAVLAATAAPAGASHEAGTGADHDFAVGAARNTLLEVTPFPADLRLAAHAFSGGVSGHAVGSGVFPPGGAFHVEGEVTCLRVVGNRATVKYRFKTTRGPGAPPPGWGVQVFIEDNGEPSGGTPDANATDAPLPPEVFEPTAGVCELPRGPYNPVDDGNYVVHDG
jgi:hypothetical protein